MISARRRSRVRPAVFLAAALAVLVPYRATGAVSPQVGQSPDAKVHVDLVSEVTSVQPGTPFWVALRQRIAPGWHTYWQNPGDSGEPLTLVWSLPPGASADDIAWPPPQRIPAGLAMGYGFVGEVLLPIRITPPSDLRPGASLVLRAAAEWLVCEKECIPEEASVSLTLPVGAGSAAPNPVWRPAIEQARASLPRPSPWPLTVEVGPDAVALTLRQEGLVAERIADAWFYPLEWGLIDHAAPQVMSVSQAGLRLHVARGSLPEAAQRPVEGVLVLTERLEGAPVRHAFSVRVDPGAPRETPSMSLLLRAMALALLGGLVLNLMPCVLPVLAVKALALVAHGGGSRPAMRRHGLAYTAGVLAAFAAVAGALLALRAGGEQVGWGFQLQSPTFVAILAYGFFLMALVLSGAVLIGGRLAGLGSSLAARPGYVGSFFTGALAAVVATPCTAPFMATAVGYAVTQPAVVALVVFETLGFGLALPYLALSMAPGVIRMLPRPGPWMNRLKQLLAFPLYATVAWLTWVVAQQAGPAGLAAFLAGLVLVAFAAWLSEATRHAATPARGVARAAALTLAVLAVVLVPLTAGQSAGPVAVTGRRAGAGPTWEPYTPARLAELRSRGVPVFVNFTAAWCITCLVNERLALRSPEVMEGFAQKGVAYLKADWTGRDPEIGRALAAFARSGVPLYLLYPGGTAAAATRPRILPQLLTEGIVLEAIRDL